MSGSILKDKILISVIIITYNQEEFIEQAVKGVLMQEGDFNIELIIGEDCSTDNTRSVCLRLQDEYPNQVRLLLQKTNQGLLRNYLSTLSLAKGDFIAQLAGDDYWTQPSKLAQQLEILQNNPSIGLVYTDADYLFENGEIHNSIFKNKIVRQHFDFLNHLEYGGFIAPSTWLYRSEYNPAYMGYDDFDFVDESFPFILDMYQKSEIFFFNHSTTVYRKVTDSLSDPKDLKNRYKYYKGIFEIQKLYMEKYFIDKHDKNRICFKWYLKLLNMAIETNDQSFLDECNIFFQSHEIRFESVINKLQLFTKWNERRERFKRFFIIRTFVKIRNKARS